MRQDVVDAGVDAQGRRQVLAHVTHGLRFGAHARHGEPVGWREFETTPDDELATLDEALFETAHLIAGFAAADGAVVMNNHHDILGFGGMISGRLPAVRSVASPALSGDSSFRRGECGGRNRRRSGGRR
jgi:hypothetical protein